MGHVCLEFSQGGPVGTVWLEENFNFQQCFWLGLEKHVFWRIGDAAKNARRNVNPCHSLQQSSPAGDYRGHSVCSGSALAPVVWWGCRCWRGCFVAQAGFSQCRCASSHMLIAPKGGFSYETNFQAHPQGLPMPHDSSCAGRQCLAQYWVLEGTCLWAWGRLVQVATGIRREERQCLLPSDDSLVRVVPPKWRGCWHVLSSAALLCPMPCSAGGAEICRGRAGTSAASLHRPGGSHTSPAPGHTLSSSAD